MLIYLQKIAKGIDLLNDIVGRSVAWLMVVMVIVTCGVVIARYLFGTGSIALQESVMYMHGSVFMLAIAFTLKEKAHVRVDILHERFDNRTCALIDMLGTTLFLMPVTIFIFWVSLDYVSFSWALSESSSQPGGLPGVYILKTLIPAMAGLLILQAVAEFLRSLLKFQKKAV